MEYKIIGGTLPAVVLTLQAKESIITQNGAMCWMSANMSMETTTNGGAGKAVGRIFTGERMFQNIYTAEGGPGCQKIMVKIRNSMLTVCRWSIVIMVSHCRNGMLTLSST